MKKHNQPTTNFIIPAIDIIGGRLVRLTQGDYEQVKNYDTDPLEMAKRFEMFGVGRLHIVDLDGARRGQIRNLGVLEKIAAATSLSIDFGGGIKTRQDVESVLNAGAQMITIGSMAVKAPDLLGEWIALYGADRFFIGADVYQNNIKIHGWQEDTALSLFEFLERMRSIGVRQVFCTDIEKDGMLQGPATALYKQLLENFPGFSLVASGGVQTIQQLKDLQQIGCSGAIVGKAIYEGHLSLRQLGEFNSPVLNN